MTKNSKNSSRKYERGNAFIIVLVGVILFAALSFTVARSMRSESTQKMSAQELKLAVSDVISYSQQIERAVNRLRRKGCSENDISFDNSVVSGYAHTPAAPDECKIFHPNGGNLKWRSPPEGVNDGTDYLFNSNYVGTFDLTSQFVGTSASDLVMTISNIDRDFCDLINEQTNGHTVWEGTGAHDKTNKFTGTFPATALTRAITRNNLDTPETGCFCDILFPTCTDAAPHYYYHTLLAR